jgi:two-component system, OmpR family, phosphate regulon sensor histidine kinase PhoR
MSDINLSDQSSAIFAAFDSILDDGLILINHKHVVLRANEYAFDMVGRRILGQPITNYVRHPDLPRCLSEAVNSKMVQSFIFTKNEQAQRRFRVNVAGVEEGNGLFVLRFTDLTKSKNVERIQTDFVANVSHELRSPLTAIIGFIETLQDNLAEDPEIAATFLPFMQGEAMRMQRLVDELLTLSRVEADEHLPPNDIVWIMKVIDQVVALFDIRSKELNRQIIINASSDINALKVKGDADALLQVFSNLLENALNYGAADTEIHIDCEVIPAQGSLPSRVIVAVRNQGLGIDAVHIGRVTERFYRVDNSRSRKLGGSGLGLAIVKHIIGWHRGSLTITSVPGQETVFAVKLPLIVD